jgi:hypothetical protein
VSTTASTMIMMLAPHGSGQPVALPQRRPVAVPCTRALPTLAYNIYGHHTPPPSVFINFNNINTSIITT